MQTPSSSRHVRSDSPFFGGIRPAGARSQVVGSLTPNSAAAERVISLLKLMFGDMQMSALADMIQAALMLKYNQRKVG